MEIARIFKPDRKLHGRITLEGSKSLSNRALIALALSGARAEDWLQNLSVSNDTAALQRLLGEQPHTCDAGDAGTTFRFLTAFLALRPGVQVLTGSPRMRERPIGALVEALRTLGADIAYLERVGFPPLRIGPPGQLCRNGNHVRIDAGVSSQFLSALLLIGPYLPGGLRLTPEGRLVSRSYLDMTLHLMRFFGADAGWENQTLVVQPGTYRPRMLRIEADWSAASYWYAMAALAEDAGLTLTGLSEKSWQGDAVLVPLMAQFGVDTVFTPEGLMLQKRERRTPPEFEFDFLECPDIAQSLAVVCAGLGVSGCFSGLETLVVKETDRCAALTAELAKAGVAFRVLPHRRAVYELRGKAQWHTPPRFATYGDHRMAMAFAALGMLGTVRIEQPAVVRKSYPAFWDHLAQAGFILQKREMP